MPHPKYDVVVFGATSFVGQLLAAYLAEHFNGVNEKLTWALAGRSEAKLAVVAAQGADHVIAGPFRDRVKELTGHGVDVVYDGVGGEISVESLRCVRFAARYLIVGWAATPFVGRAGANHLPTNLIMMKSVDVLGCPTVLATERDPALRPPRLAQVLAWAERGEISPHVSHVFPLAQFRDAMRAKWRGDVVGGAVLHP